MKRNPSWTLLGVLIVLVGLAWLAGVFEGQVSTVEVPSLSLPDGKPQSIQVQQGANNVTMEFQNGVWRVTKPEEVAADSAAIARLLVDLRDLAISHVVSTQRDQYGQFGVDTSGISLTMNWEDEHRSLVVGDQGSGRNTRYVRVGNDPRVVLSEGGIEISPDIGHWRNKTLVDASPTSVRQIAMETPDASYRLESVENTWQVSVGGDEGVPADSARVAGWLPRLLPIKADGVVSGLSQDDVRNNATHSMAIRLFDGTTYHLDFQDRENDVVVVSDKTDAVFSLESYRLNRLFPDLESLRE